MTAASEPQRPLRRVGTFTLGLVLVALGLAMLLALVFPRLPVERALNAAPLILISLGAETLLALRNGSRVRYDWAGILLCFLLAAAALSMYAAAWCIENESYRNVTRCSRSATETAYLMDYEFFDGFDSHTLHLEAGDTLESRVNTTGGGLEVEVSGEDGETLYEGAPPNGTRSLTISRTGDYLILVHGHRASGSFDFQVLSP